MRTYIMPRELEVLGSMAASGGITPTGQPRRSREDLLDHCPPPYCHFGGVDWPAAEYYSVGPRAILQLLLFIKRFPVKDPQDSGESPSGPPDTGRSIRNALTQGN